MELLDECRLLAREPVHRGIEWDYLWSQANDADHSLEGHDGNVHCVRFNQKGNLLVSGGEDGRVIVWDTGTLAKRHEIDDRIEEVRCAEVSSDGSLLAIAGTDGRVVVHRMDDGSIVFDEPIVSGRIYSLSWLGDLLQLAVGGEDAVLSIIDPINNAIRRTEPLTASGFGIAHDPQHPIEIQSIAYLPGRNAVAVGMSPGGLHILDVESFAEVSRINGELIRSHEVCSIPVGSGYLAADRESTNVQVWNLDTGCWLLSLQQMTMSDRFDIQPPRVSLWQAWQMEKCKPGGSEAIPQWPRPPGDDSLATMVA